MVCLVSYSILRHQDWPLVRHSVHVSLWLELVDRISFHIEWGRRYGRQALVVIYFPCVLQQVGPVIRIYLNIHKTCRTNDMWTSLKVKLLRTFNDLLTHLSNMSLILIVTVNNSFDQIYTATQKFSIKLYTMKSAPICLRVLQLFWRTQAKIPHKVINIRVISVD